MQFAPVIIPTLCRFKHFKVCIESLAKNKYAKDTVVYVGVDYPTKDEHWDGYKKIIEYLDKKPSFFKELIVIKRSINSFSFQARSLFELAFRNSDRVIFSEDDNEFAPNFLEYMNKGLDLYKDDYSIMTICGYSRPAKWKFDENSMYKNNSMSAWGYGIWKNRYIEFLQNISVDNFKKWLFDDHRAWELFTKSSWQFNHIINGIYNNSLRMMDMTMIAYMMLFNKYSIYPRVSKVHNHGFDGSGNCYKYDTKGFENIVLDSSENFEFYGDASVHLLDNEKALKNFYKQDFSAVFRGCCHFVLLWFKYNLKKGIKFILRRK